MLHPTVSTRPGDPLAAIEAGEPRVPLAYRRNAALMACSTRSRRQRRRPRVRLERNRAFAERNAAAIRRLQEQGLADPDLDP